MRHRKIYPNCTHFVRSNIDCKQMSSSLMNKVFFCLMIHNFYPKSQQINCIVNGLDMQTFMQNYFFAYDETKDDISSHFLTFYIGYI